MKENVKKGKDEGYISFDPEELKNATQEGDPNDEAYELLWEATCVSSHVNDDEKECGHIESDNIYPTTAAEVDAMLGSFEEVLKEVSGAAFCGSLPDGTDPALYIRAAKLAGAYKVPLLIDARRDLDEVFAAGAEIILKINREELAELSGLQDPLEGLRSLFSRFANLKYAAITDGPGKAFAADGSQIAFYTLPELKFIASPLGCGDTASAILLSEICSGKDIFTAFRYALAAASANCLNPTPGKFDPAEAEKLLPDLEYSVL